MMSLLKNNRPKTFNISFFILVLLFLVSTVLMGSRSVELRGNTTANLNNGGFAAESDGWIYTIDPYWEYNALYKVKPDGSEVVKLFDGDCSSINVVGDWVYFVYYYRYTGYTLYKIPKSGGKAIALATRVMKIFVVSDWIYCQSAAPEGISKIRTDGTEKTSLFDESATLFDVRNGWVFFLQYESDFVSQDLFKVRTDGSEKQLVLKGLIKPVTDGQWIYYGKRDEIRENSYSPLVKCRMDGSREQILTQQTGWQPFLSGTWLYYNANGGIYRMKTDGTDSSNLSPINYVYMNAAADWLIYREHDDAINARSYVLYKMRPDGSEPSTFWGDPGSYE